jgi:hypothetical protein
MVVQDRQREIQNREAAVSKPEPKGMIPSAQASIPPAETRDVQQRPQAQTREGAGSYEPIIQEEAKKNNVRPELVRAVIGQESKGDPRAMGKDQDAGLMQLLPGTQKDMGVTDPFDPKQNIAGGTKYLGQLIQRYNGDERNALMAYNWGMKNVDNALKTGGQIPQQVQAYADGILARSGQAASQGGGSSFFDLLQKLPAQEQNKVKANLDRLTQQYRAGQLSEQDLRSEVLLAWTAVPNTGGIETAEQARAIANDIIQQKGR